MAGRKAAALLVAVCVDLSLCYAAGLVETRSPLGHLARAWAHAALRCSALTAVALLFLGHLDPVLTRVAAAHGLLPAVFETGSHALYGEVSARGSSLDARRWFTCAAASLAAALFWEVTVRVTVRDTVRDTVRGTEGDAAAGQERKQKARVLLVRVLRMFRPEYPLLLGGLAMLTMAVSCLNVGTETWRSWYHDDDDDDDWPLAGASSSPSDITSRLSRDTPLVGRAVCLNINVLLRTSVRTLGVLGLMAGLSWRLSLLVLMEAPVIVLIQNLHDTHHQRLSLAVQDSTARAAVVVNEVVSGIRAVRSFNAEQQEARRYDDRLMDTQVLKTRQSSLKAVYLLSLRLTGLAMKVIMLYYSRLLIQSGQMTTGNLVSFLLYQSDLGGNFRTLTFIFGDMLNSVGAAGKVFEYLDRKPEVCMDGTLQPDQLTGHVIFHKLIFAYPTSPKKAVLQVGAGGGHLTRSGRQQIALARALVRRPRLLVLDEVASSLDTDTENKILQTLADCSTQTRLLVSHKLNNMEALDQIAVMEDGRVRERGTHRELMELQGIYCKLWSDTH